MTACSVLSSRPDDNNQYSIVITYYPLYYVLHVSDCQHSVRGMCRVYSYIKSDLQNLKQS